MLAFLVGASVAVTSYAVIYFNQRLNHLTRINCVLLVETRHDHAEFAAHAHIPLNGAVPRVGECNP